MRFSTALLPVRQQLLSCCPPDSAGADENYERQVWGDEDAAAPRRPNGGYVIGEETVAGAGGSGRDAPKNEPAFAGGVA